jgi:hypothetical protein
MAASTTATTTTLDARISGGMECTSAAFEGFAKTVEGLTDEAEANLDRSLSAHDSLQDDVRQLASDFKEVHVVFFLLLSLNLLTH